MKTIIIGDIHGRDTWKQIVEQEQDAHRIVFLGDYFDSFDIKGVEQLHNFNEIIKFWKNRENADIINGNRNPRKDFLYRRFYSKLALIIYRLFFNIKL